MIYVWLDNMHLDFFYRLYSDYYFIDNGERVKNRTTFHLAVAKAINVLKNCQRHRTLRSCLFDFKINADLVKRKVSNKKDYTPNWRKYKDYQTA